MREVKKFWDKYFSSFLYSLAITFGIYISIEELHKYQNRDNFIIFSVAVFALLSFEIALNYLKRNSSLVINLDINDKVNELSELFHKFILPLLLYVSLVGYAYYNIDSNYMRVVLFFTFITFFVLFLNTRAFFQLEKGIESQTHYVYDIIKFLIFFTSVNTLSHLHLDGWNLYLIGLAVTIVTIVLTTLMIVRFKRVSIMSIGYIAITSLLTGAIFLILSSLNTLNSSQISLILVFVFYLSIAIIHHVLNRTLTREVIFEYIVVLAVVLAISTGIT